MFYIEFGRYPRFGANQIFNSGIHIFRCVRQVTISRLTGDDGRFRFCEVFSEPIALHARWSLIQNDESVSRIFSLT